MWYLIRRNSDSKITLRYYNNTSKNPDLVFQDKRTFNWIDSIYDFTHPIIVRPSNIYASLNTVLSDSDFTIISLPNLPRDIDSIDDVITGYPEFFI